MDGKESGFWTVRFVPYNNARYRGYSFDDGTYGDWVDIFPPGSLEFTIEITANAVTLDWNTDVIWS